METPAHGKTPANPFGEQFRTFHFYPSESHKQVVHRITRGLEGNCGLILLTGEIGIGKTSVCRHIMQSFGDSYVFAESGNPFLKPAEQLYHFCKQFSVDTTGRNSIHDLTEALNMFFVEQAEQGCKPVIIIDESHLLATEHFSLLLVLYNMRIGSIPLVQIILIGQVEIMGRLREPGFEALNQRIGVRCELSPLNMQETLNYIKFKLDHAEFPNRGVFERKTLKRIHQVTGGLPRLINHACSHALDQISFTGAEVVSEKLIDEVSSDPMYQDLFTIRTKKDTQKYRVAAGIVATLFVGVLAATQLSFFTGSDPAPIAVTEPQATTTATPVATIPVAAIPTAPTGTVAVQPVKTVQPIQTAQPVQIAQPVQMAQPVQVTAQVAVVPTASPIQPIPPVQAIQVVQAPPVQRAPAAPASTTLKPARVVQTVQAPPVQSVRAEPAPVQPAQVAVVEKVAPQPALKAVAKAPKRPAKKVVTRVKPKAVKTQPAKQAPVVQVVQKTVRTAPPVMQPVTHELPPLNTGIATAAPEPAYAISPRKIEKTPEPKVSEEAALVFDETTHPAIKALQVSAVAWSASPEARMAVVNDRIFHEGDQVGALTLETINRSYLIFSLNGIRYRKNAS